MKGRVEVICGPMFSGKSEELLRRVHRTQLASLPVLLFKPKMDTRYSENEVVSHGGVRKNCLNITAAEEILVYPRVAVVGIDEAQFLQGDLVFVVETLAHEGVRVVLAGLDTDYLGKPFGCMGSLLAVADEVTKLKAVCMRCGADAAKTYRVAVSSEQVMVGGMGEYEARCRACWRVAGV
jgi:thymidine kinase